MTKQTEPAVNLRRARWGEGEAKAALADWQRSGKSLAAFARELGVSAITLARWRDRLGSPAGSSNRVLVPMHVTAPPVGCEAVVVTAGEVRVELGAMTAASAAWVAQLARSMNEARQ